MSRRVAVIGAGVAGLTAARRLKASGWDVVVFDKARGVGGRTSTRRREEAAFDHGAQYFTCRGPRFTEQVEDWCRRGVVAEWRAPIHEIRRGEFAAREGTRRFVGSPRMSRLARDLAEGIQVECRRRVVRLEGAARSWKLVCEDGEGFGPFDAVVVATPAPQAAPLLEPVAHLSERVARVEMLPCHAVLVTFPSVLPDVDFGGAFVAESPLAWVARNVTKPGRPESECWVLHSSSEWSAAHLDDASDVVTSTLLEALADALAREIPAPTRVDSHLWRLARAAKPLGVPFLWDGDLAIACCGDWLQGDRVEDAFESGDALAEAMLAS